MTDISYKYHNDCMKAIEPHIVKTVITDFNGKAKFDPIPFGKYFLIGVHKTPKGGIIVWNKDLFLQSNEESLIVDQNNSAYMLEY